MGEVLESGKEFGQVNLLISSSQKSKAAVLVIDSIGPPLIKSV